ncbi:MAG: ribonuclease P protein component [Desulfurivibrio sp.]|nr:ribonuclease P protein component [Desulfurivibrio sp.]MBU3937095.1 ribonuclease P protein component [Pseudomonadota bacterium]MBU4118030.1 ribonuclease P protein component [Pseudomonadota bacterium]
MKAHVLSKAMLLLKPWQYRLVYSQGKRVRGQNFSLIYLPNSTTGNRLGISIHGVRQAVQRNRIKRVIREFFRHNPGFLEPFSDVVFAVRPGFALDSPQEIETAVRALLARRQVGGKTTGPDEEALKVS